MNKTLIVTCLMVMFFSTALTTDSGFLLQKITDLQLVWSDAGSGGTHDISIWRPKTTSNKIHTISHVAVYGYNKPEYVWGLIATNQDDVKSPVGYYPIWSDRGSGAHTDVQVYGMFPPQGYTCLGNVAVNNYLQVPQDFAIKCIKNDKIQWFYSVALWNDQGSGSNQDGSCWIPNIIYQNSVYYPLAMFFFPNYNNPLVLPSINQSYLLKMDDENVQKIDIKYDYDSYKLFQGPTEVQSDTTNNYHNAPLTKTFSVEIVTKISQTWQNSQTQTIGVSLTSSYSIQAPISDVGKISVGSTFGTTQQSSITNVFSETWSKQIKRNASATKVISPCSKGTFVAQIYQKKLTIPYQATIYLRDGRQISFSGTYHGVGNTDQITEYRQERLNECS